VDQQGRRLTYRDGVRFSSATVEGASKYPEYAAHAPEVKEEEPEQQQEQEAQPGFPVEFQNFIDATEGAKTWNDVKVAMATFWATPLFKGMRPDQQAKIRRDTWLAAKEHNVQGIPDHAADASAYRLWIEACDDPDAIVGTLRILEGRRLRQQVHRDQGRDPQGGPGAHRSPAGRVMAESGPRAAAMGSPRKIWPRWRRMGHALYASAAACRWKSITTTRPARCARSYAAAATARSACSARARS
jgi:hypothetical protein